MAESDQTTASAAPASRPFASRRARLRLVAGSLFGIALLGWLLSRQSFLNATVWKALAHDPVSVSLIALMAAVVQTTISTVKWRMLLERGSPEIAKSVSWAHLFFYTAAGNAMGQLVPAYLAGPMVRGFAMKARHSGHFTQQAALAGYEQVFDVAILVIGGAVALSLLLCGSSGWGGPVSIMACLVAGCLFPVLLPAWGGPAQIAGWFPVRWRVTRHIGESLSGGAAAGLGEATFLSALMGLSAFRYAALSIRTVLMGLILLPAVSWSNIALAFSAVQLSALAAFTPGNLGITELGWGAMNAFVKEAGASDFVAFALALRLSGLLASGLILGLAVSLRSGAR